MLFWVIIVITIIIILFSSDFIDRLSFRHECCFSCLVFRGCGISNSIDILHCKINGISDSINDNMIKNVMNSR